MNKKSGQIAIFVILIALLGLTVVLSIASRAVSDIKQTTYTDNGVRAYAAAEAGARYALSLYPLAPSCTSVPTGLSLPQISSLTYRYCTGTATYLNIPLIAADDVFDVDLTPVDAKTVSGLYLIWNNNNAQVEAEVLGGNWNPPDYSLRRFVWAGTGLSTSQSNFWQAVNGNGCVNLTNCAPGDVSMAGGSCSGNVFLANTDPNTANPNRVIQVREPNFPTSPAPPARTLRIKALGAATGVAVCGVNSSGQTVSLNLQTRVITSTATTANGVVKRIQVTLGPPTMPAIFDNAIFSGGDLSK